MNTLSGANNPIFQASQAMAEQAGHEKNMAIQGIINQTMQSEAKKMAAQMDMYTKLTTESKDPSMQKMALMKLGEITGNDFSGVTNNLDPVISKLRDLRKVVMDTSGTYTPEFKQEIWNNFTTEHGSQYTADIAKTYQGNLENDYLKRGVDIGTQAAATPDLKPHPTDIPDVVAGKQEVNNFVKGQQIEAFSKGGTVGEAEAKKLLSPTEKTSFRVEPAPKGYKSPNGTTTGFVYKDEISGKIAGDAPDPTAGTKMKLDMFRTMPTPTPGIFFDRESRKYFKINENGQEIPLTSAQVKDANLQYKEETPTSDIRVMQQSAPAVLFLANKVKQNINSLDLGPVSSRWQEFMAGKVGAPNDKFTKLRTDVGLLQTRLMKMHVGSRGGEYMMKHFSDLMDAAKQSPENLKAALDEIVDYANETKSPKFGGSDNGTPTTQSTSVKSADDFLRKKGLR